MLKDCVFDLETFPNIFTAKFMQVETGLYWSYEISERRNDLVALLGFLNHCRSAGMRLCGFNNLGFDYPILHMIMLAQGVGIDVHALYQKAQSIIFDQSGDGWGHAVAAWQVLIPQLDLYKINHFDNRSKSTGLKALQFNMRSDSVEELPFPPGTVLTWPQMDTLDSYGFHDITETVKFYWECKPLIDFRDTLTATTGRDHTNYNDTKIGKEYFIARLEEIAPGTYYEYGTRKVRQTIRDRVYLRTIIFPYIKFEHPEFRRIHEWLLAQSVDALNVKGFFSSKKRSDDDEEWDEENIVATIDGFEFKFGAGGIHGSILRRTIHADDQWCIFDIDVGGYYPDVAIQNKLFPAHLGEAFVMVNAENKARRAETKKGTPANAMLKLANNGVYGDSGNPYSGFLDIAYLLSTTINGQLLLCMLAEQLLKVPSLELIQINTDGMTMRVKRSALDHCRTICEWWQGFTCLKLEENFYAHMFVRDVNTYTAVTEPERLWYHAESDSYVAAVEIGDSADAALCMEVTDSVTHEAIARERGVKLKPSKTKRKGACSWVRGLNLSDGELAWHQDHSSLVIQMAAEAHTLDGADIGQYVHGHRDIFDFLIRAKVPKASRLQLADGTPLPNLLRYYISTDGQALQKIMPPTGRIGDFKRKNGLSDWQFNQIEASIGGSHAWDERIHTKNRSQYAQKVTGIDKGFKVTPCNHIRNARFENIDYQYYIDAARKLVSSLGYFPHNPNRDDISF